MKRNYYDGYHVTNKYWKEKKAQMPPLDDVTREIIWGFALGTKCFSFPANDQAIFFKIRRPIQEGDYFRCLLKRVQRYSYTPAPILEIKTSKTNGKLRAVSLNFKTYPHTYFNQCRDQVYRGVRSFPDAARLREILTPRVLAHWLMSGAVFYKKKNTLHLNDLGYRESTGELANYREISKALNSVFGLHSQLYDDGKKIRVEIPRRDGKLLRTLVGKYMLPSMIYKLPPMPLAKGQREFI